jgi:hypothetical protein
MTQALSRRERWDVDGYLVAPGFFADLAPQLDAEAQRLAGRTDLINLQNIRCRWADHVDTKECRFDCFDPVVDLSEPMAQAAHDPRLLALLAELYGEPAYLFKDKLIYKPDGAPGYDLHQDYIAWQEFPTEPLAEVARAGFVNVRLVRLADKPHFTIGGAEMREILVSAMRPPGDEDGDDSDDVHRLVYRGPFASVTDDAGITHVRGQRSYVRGAHLAALLDGPAAADFAPLDLAAKNSGTADGCC